MSFFTAGQKLRASDLNGALEFPVARLYQGAAQTILNNTWTALTFDQEAFDTHSGHSTSVNTSRYTVPTGWSGYYWVQGLTFFATGTTGIRGVSIAVNASRIVGTMTRTDPVDLADGDGLPSKAVILSLTAGDFVETHAIHTQGASVNTFFSGGATEASSMDIFFLRP